MKLAKNSCVMAVAAGLALMSSGVLAVEAGNILVRAGAAHVSPNTSSEDFKDSDGDPTGIKVDVGSNTQLGLNFTYMVTDNIGVELLAATPFKHSIKGAGTLSGAGTIGETKHLPPTVTVQYHINPQGAVRPYVGAGINYTTFFETKGKGALAGTDISLDDSWGLAGVAGVDVDLGSGFFLNGAAYYADINTDANVGNGTYQGEVEIDPWVFMVGVGTSF